MGEKKWIVLFVSKDSISIDPRLYADDDDDRLYGFIATVRFKERGAEKWDRIMTVYHLRDNPVVIYRPREPYEFEIDLTGHDVPPAYSPPTYQTMHIGSLYLTREVIISEPSLLGRRILSVSKSDDTGGWVVQIVDRYSSPEEPAIRVL